MLRATRVFTNTKTAYYLSPTFKSVSQITTRSLQNDYNPQKEANPKESFTSWERRVGDTVTRFPDWIEKWDRQVFYGVAGASSMLTVGVTLLFGVTSPVSWLFIIPVSGFCLKGFADIRQKRHTIRRNFPVLGNVRYLFESIRPEIRQYFIEADNDAAPFSRIDRSVVYQRSKKMQDTVPFGTRHNVYDVGYEFVNHSLWPKVVSPENTRQIIGGPACKQPYSASLFNISGMSHGSLSDNAILALNTGAKFGGFYHNTGEGGISKYHLRPGGDIVWNIGTGYFGCRTSEGKFSPENFVKTVSQEQVKMIEVKLSQGAKPAHGGILPKSKISDDIAEARGLVDRTKDCISPPTHSAFDGAVGLIRFVDKLRELSGGKPVGFKLCIGRPEEFAAVVRAMLELDITPDFITVDGAEGGTGAAPLEFSNRVGCPLVEGLTYVDRILTGCGLRERIKIISAGKITTGFHLVKHLALGADLCNAARGMMFALGCIQALKCNTNTCPSGVATQNKELMFGLDVDNKSIRVYNFHHKTVESALEIIGAVGLDDPNQLQPEHVNKRVSSLQVLNYSQIYPLLEKGSLLNGTAPPLFQAIWDKGGQVLASQKHSLNL